MAQLPLKTADCCLILSEYYSEDETPIAIDSRNLTTAISLKKLLTEGSSRRQSATSPTFGTARGYELLPQDPKSAGKKKKVKVVTELLDPKSQRVVEGHDNVRKLGSFIYSNALETGVFAMAVREKPAYTILMQLLAPNNEAGHIVMVPIGSVVHGTASLSFYDLHARVLQACSGLLLGWKRVHVRYPELNPGSKAEKMHWSDDTGDVLLLFRPHAEPSDVAPGRPLSSLPELDKLSCMPPGCIPPSIEVTGPAVEAVHRH
eukprot:UN0991